MSWRADDDKVDRDVGESTATAALARWAASLRYEDLPAAAVNAATRGIIDSIGCALAGSRERVATALIKLGKEAGGEPQASVLGHAERFSGQWSALINGTMAHAIDFDDTHISVIGHPSVTLVPAAFATGELVNASGRDLIVGYVAGLEIMGRIARIVNLAHYDRGWHSTSTIGVLGAAVASARMFGLNVRQLRHALGIAASLSSGLKKNFGTDTKPLHAGAAARNGVFAAQLARESVDADPNVFEGPMSFCSVAGEPGRTLDLSSLADLGEAWQAIEPGLNFKRFPACYSAHRVVNAILELASRHDLHAEQVDSIECGTSYGAVEKLAYERPGTPLEAKFSMQYCAAASLIDRGLGMPQFTEERVRRTDVRALMSRVVVKIHPELATPEQIVKCNFGEATIRLKDGRVFSERVEYPLGHAKRPLTDDQIDGKFLENATMVLSRSVAEQGLRELRGLNRCNSVRTIMATFAKQR